MEIDIILTPLEALPERIEGKTVVVIDVFRATSCICAAMASGAKKLIPFTSIEQCLEEQKRWEGSSEKIVMGGERKMLPIEGFELGNSPLSYTKEVVEGAVVIMSTTNGTRSIEIAQNYSADKILVASLGNAKAVAEELSRDGRDVTIFCAGRADRFSIEDTLCAGYISTLLEKSVEGVVLGEAAWWAADVYKRYSGDLREAMQSNRHYHRLNSLGMSADVDYALTLDTMDIVPRVVDGAVVVE